MAIGCGAKFSKFILFIFNILFWISGLILIVTGAIYIATGGLKHFEEIIRPNDRSLTLLLYVIIGLGCLIFIIGFCGCCGAIKESQLLLGIYIGFILVIMIAEIGCGIYAMIKQPELRFSLISLIISHGQLTNDVEKSLRTSIKDNYPPDNNNSTNQNLKQAIDFVQSSFDCCGVTTYKDWNVSIWYKNRTDMYMETPISCCSIPGREARTCFNEQKYFKKGCNESLRTYIKSKFPIIIGILIGIALFEILVVVFACCLCKNTGNVAHSVI